MSGKELLEIKIEILVQYKQSVGGNVLPFLGSYRSIPPQNVRALTRTYLEKKVYAKHRILVSHEDLDKIW
jgi:hypothetical protein